MDLYDLKLAAKFLKCSTRTVRRKAHSLGLRFKGHPLFTQDELLKMRFR